MWCVWFSSNILTKKVQAQDDDDDDNNNDGSHIHIKLQAENYVWT